MGGNHAVGRRRLALAGVILAWGWMACGATLVAEGFWTTGQCHAGWYWLDPRCRAQWEFFSLPPGGDPYVVVEAFLCLPVSQRSSPAEIAVRFKIETTSVVGSRLWVARLNRIQASSDHAMYFGQLFLARREIGLGSRLTVHLDGGQVGLPIGVHPSSVRVVGGAGASPVPTPAAVLSNGGTGEAVSTVLPVASTARTLPASDRAEVAPFLAPGTYHGTLGWLGPYEVPQGKGLYKVHLRAGEVITVRIETNSPCVLLLLDPSGRRVGEIEGSSWLGLEYRAHQSGAWQLIVACSSGGPQFSYTLSLAIRSG